MKIKVRDEAVQKNIELFKKLVEKQKRLQKPAAQNALEIKNSKTYMVFLNRQTGALLFPEIVDDLAELKERTWRPICIRVRNFRYPHHKAEFEVIEDERNEAVFKYSDLEPLAMQVLAETIKVLNAMSHHLKTHLDIEEALQEFCLAKVEFSTKMKSKSILYKAWHQLDRIEAEQLLHQQEEGAYLFRKDYYTLILEDQLCRRYRIVIKCWTLTVLQTKGKVTDYTIVEIDGKWLFYNDDPNLQEAWFNSIEELLETKKDIIRSPILQEE